jgi:hypothetical protein
MSNDYHLAIETPEANLVPGMQWPQNTFTRRFNLRHRSSGEVLGDRYTAVLVEPDAGYYQQTLCDFIHHSTVPAGLTRACPGVF